jgi:hypothetical protein
MLIRKTYKGCSRLYWELEDFDQEAPDATFQFQGKTHFLEFDGCVDDLIWNNLRSTRCAAIDIAELYEAVPLVDEASALLGSGQKLTLRLSTGQDWVAAQQTFRYGTSVVLRSSLGQSATIRKDENNRIKRLILRTEGKGISHEIKAELGIHGQLEPIAEAVTIFHS